MFKVKTYDELLKECLDNAPEGIDTRQGSIFYDACAAKCLVLAQTYADLETIQDMCHVDTAIGEYLDAFGKDHGITRHTARSMMCRAVFEGAEPKAGSRFFIDGIFFVLKNNLDELYPEDDALLDEGVEYLEAEIAGSAANVVEEGDSIVPYNDIVGLSSAKIGKIIAFGEDEEPDERYRARIQNKLCGPAENGNRFHYKEWCESRPGVGCAKVLPLVQMNLGELIYSPNCVSALLYTSEGTPVLQATFNDVQEYIDPYSRGLGEGKAPIGAHFFALNPDRVNFFVSAKVTLSANEPLSSVTEKVTELIEDYLKELALSDLKFVGWIPQKPVIRYKKIYSILANIEGVEDFEDLKISIGGNDFVNENISIEPFAVALLAENGVSLTELTSDEGESELM